MATVFIGGSIDIRELDPEVKARIDRAIAQGDTLVIGESAGIDSCVQAYLQERGAGCAVVYSSGSEPPRSNVGDWPVEHVEVTHAEPGTRAFFAGKDTALAQAADWGLMVWNGRSSGTLRDVVELLRRGKTSVVFLHENKVFVEVRSLGDFDRLIARMSEAARRDADKEIGLQGTLTELRSVSP